MHASRPTTTRPPGGNARARAGLRRRASTFLALIGVALLAVAGTAVPAAAHGGDVVISLGTDGQGGVSANLTYKNDGHPVEESADVKVTAKSEDGETVGPLTLKSASEGVGWYVSEPEVLDEGHWVLTAKMTEPSKAKATSEVDVVPVVPPSSDDAEGKDAEGKDAKGKDAKGDDAAKGDGAAGDGAAAGGDEPAADDGDDPAADDAAAGDAADQPADSAGSSTTTWWVVGGIVVLVAAGAAVFVARRRNRTSARPAGR